MIGEEQCWFLLGVGWGGQHGVMAIGVEAKHHFGGRWFFDTQALRADGHAAIAADADEGAHAPDIIPPRTTRGGPQNGAFFLFGLIPGPLRGLAQFAMHFVSVAMRPQVVNLRIGGFDLGDLFTGEVGGQAALPVLVGAFDFAFGLWRGGIAETDVIELERPAQLGQGIGILGEKEAVIIHIDLERAAVGEKGGGQEVQVGQQEFALVKFGAGEEAAAIIQHVEHGKGLPGVGKPAVGRGVQLPEFADLRALPAAHGSQDSFGRGAAWASWLASAQRRTWARSSLKPCRRRASEAAKL